MGRVNHLGEEGISFNGEKMKIVAYRGTSDIDVEFEDGGLALSKNYSCFKRGHIKNPNYIRTKHLGESIIANNGMKMTIIEYRSTNDIDVEFEDGAIVQHVRYCNFRKARIASGTEEKLSDVRIGQTVTKKDGTVLRLVAYHSAKNVDVEVVGFGIVYGRKYSCFLDGHIAYRNPYTNRAGERIGEERIADDGQKTKIIAYRTAQDIDVEYEDGFIVRHTNYSNFLRGNAGKNEHTRLKHIGEESMSNCGMKMRIVAFRTFKDIDVEFEDGVVKEHIQYSGFKTGEITHPGYKNRMDFSKIGEVRIANNGVPLKITKYESARNFEITAIDGVVITGRKYGAFAAGEIAHPAVTRTRNRQGLFLGFKIIEWIGREEDDTFYRCKCMKCGEMGKDKEDVLSPVMMAKHANETHGMKLAFALNNEMVDKKESE